MEVRLGDNLLLVPKKAEILLLYHENVMLLIGIISFEGNVPHETPTNTMEEK